MPQCNAILARRFFTLWFPLRAYEKRRAAGNHMMNVTADRRKTGAASSGGLAALKDARSFMALLRRRWLILTSVAAGVTIAVVAAALLLTPMWSATVQIKIDPNRRSPIEFKTEPQVGPPDQALVDTEVGIMESPDVARGVVERLDLVKDPDF